MGGISTANVVALQQYLVATSTNALDLVTKALKASVLVAAQ